MAERSVIREDVVSIGFETNENPFGDLTDGINEIRENLSALGEMEAGLRGVNREAALAYNGMESLANSIHAPPDAGGLADSVREVTQETQNASNEVQELADGIQEVADGIRGTREETENTRRETERTKVTFTGLLAQMKDVGKQKLTDGVEKLTSGLKAPVVGFQNLIGKAKSLKGTTLGDITHKLNEGLGETILSAGKAAPKLKKIAGIGFDAAASGVKTLSSGMKSLAEQAGKAAKALGSKAFSGMKALGKGIATGITAGSVALAGISTAAVTVGAGFEASMSQVAATMGMAADEANYSNEKYAMLANTAKEMGAATKFSASEAAEALNYMALAGYEAEESCAALPTVLNLAASGGMDLAAASDMVTDSMSALGIEATQENLTKFGDQLAKTAQKSNTSVAQLGEAILTVGGTAKTLAGDTFEEQTRELNTLLGIIADNGVKGAEGGTALRNIMLSLQAPTDTAAKKMKKLGLNVYDAEGKMRPMNDILNDLNKSMDGMTDQKKQDVLSTIFNKNDLKSVNALLANSSERYDELSGYINDSAGAMANMADTMNDNLTGRVTEFKSAMEGAGIAIYEAIGSSNLKDFVKEASGWVSELTKATEEGGLEGLVGQLGTTLSKAVVTVSGYLPNLIDSGASIIDSLLEGILDNQDAILESVTGAVFKLGEGILKIAPKIMVAGMGIVASLAKGLASNLPKLIPAAIEGIQTLKNGFLTYAPQLLSTAGSLVEQLTNGLIASGPSLITSASGLVIKIMNGITQGFPLILTTGLNIVGSLAAGIVSNVPQLLSSGIAMVVPLAQGIGQCIPTMFQSAGSLIGSLLEGIVANIPNIVKGAWEIVKALVGGILSADWLQVGKDVIGGIADGIKSWFGGGKESGEKISESVVSGIEPAKLESSGQQLSASLAEGITSGTPQIQLVAAEQTDTIQETFQQGFSDIQTDASQFSDDIKNTIEETDLYSSGQNIMQGLNSGMLSMQGILNSTARSIGSGISDSLNNSLDIHSPSGVTEETGRFTGLGLVKGLKGMTGKVKESAQSIGMTTAQNIIPFKKRYTPESSQYVTNNQNSSNQVKNYYNPQFSLTLNGASASDSNERKVKRWVKESMKECFERIERSQPRPREV